MATIIKYKWSFSELQIVINFEPLHRFKKNKHHCKYLQEIRSLVCTLRYVNTFSKKKYCVIQVHVLKVKDKRTSNFFQITCTGTKRTFHISTPLKKLFIRSTANKNGAIFNRLSFTLLTGIELIFWCRFNAIQDESVMSYLPVFG